MTTLVMSPAAASARQTIHFSCLAAENFPEYQRLETLYRASFDELGYDFKMTILPEPEIDKGFRSNHYDGDCARLKGFFDEEYQDNYLLLNTSTMTMKVNIYGTKTIQNTPLDQLVAGTQPNFHFPRALAKHYNIKTTPPVTSMEAIWEQWNKGEINAYIGISYSFPTNAATAKKLGLGPRFSLIKYPLHPALNKRWLHLQPALERLLASKQITSPGKATPASPAAAKANLQNTKDYDITFGCPIAANTKTFIDLERFFKQIFTRLGLSFRMLEMPRSRESHALITGKIDGSCGRIHVPQSTTPPVRLSTVVTKDRLEIWSTRLQPLIHHLDQIPARARLAYRKGLLTQKQLRSADHIQFSPQPLADQSLLALSNNRVDYVADLHVQIDNNMAHLRIDNPIYLTGILGESQIAPYLSHQHEKLVTPVTQAIEDTLNGHQTIFDYLYNQAQP
ncbi:hypothetical protein [Candidatus Pelagadaptatus aseana]|uniref:hypothetical protein n=1 Tax=Candidatus Pelagadaptatus aseana TaxID=3120508 RepID=UPI003C6F4015